jgi:hypothetical protein
MVTHKLCQNANKNGLGTDFQAVEEGKGACQSDSKVQFVGMRQTVERKG